MSTEVHADPILLLRGGEWRLMRVTNSGRYMVPMKEGSAPMSFAPGDVLIADAQDNVIAGPIGIIPAVDLAVRILNGSERDAPNTMNMLALCAVVIDLGMRLYPPPSGPAISTEADTGDAA